MPALLPDRCDHPRRLGLAAIVDGPAQRATCITDPAATLRRAIDLVPAVIVAPITPINTSRKLVC